MQKFFHNLEKISPITDDLDGRDRNVSSRKDQLFCNAIRDKFGLSGDGRVVVFVDNRLIQISVNGVRLCDDREYWVAFFRSTGMYEYIIRASQNFISTVNRECELYKQVTVSFDELF